MAASKLLRCFRGSADSARAAAATREETGPSSEPDAPALPACDFGGGRSVLFGTTFWFFPVMSDSHHGRKERLGVYTRPRHTGASGFERAHSAGSGQDGGRGGREGQADIKGSRHANVCLPGFDPAASQRRVRETVDPASAPRSESSDAP